MSKYIKKTLQELMDDELSQMKLPLEFGTLKSFIAIISFFNRYYRMCKKVE